MSTKKSWSARVGDAVGEVDGCSVGDDEGSMVGTIVDGSLVVGVADGILVKVGEDVPSPDGTLVTTSDGAKVGEVVEGATVTAIGA